LSALRVARVWTVSIAFIAAHFFRLFPGLVVWKVGIWPQARESKPGSERVMVKDSHIVSDGRTVNQFPRFTMQDMSDLQIEPDGPLAG